MTGSHPRFSSATGLDGAPQGREQDMDTESSAGNDSCAYDSEGNLVEDGNMACNQDNFNALSEK